MNAEVKTVLLVDDEPANIQIVNSILKDIYKTRIATNGVKALELANQVPPPDLILAGCHDAGDGRLRSLLPSQVSRPYAGHPRDLPDRSN